MTSLPVFCSNASLASLAIFPPFFSCNCVLPNAFCFFGFGNLTCREFCQCSKNQFSFAHVVTQVLCFQSFQTFVLLYTCTCPFLVNDVGEKSKFIRFLHPALLPVIGEFCSGFPARSSIAVSTFHFCPVSASFPLPCRGFVRGLLFPAFFRILLLPAIA